MSGSSQPRQQAAKTARCYLVWLASTSEHGPAILPMLCGHSLGLGLRLEHPPNCVMALSAFHLDSPQS